MMSAAQLQQSEKQFQAAVIELARACQWRVAHFHDSRREVKRSDGSTRLIGDKDAKGFPDLVLARNGRIVIVELKAEKGRLSREQKEWLAALGSPEGNLDPTEIAALLLRASLPRVWVACWRPSQWDEIEEVLR